MSTPLISVRAPYSIEKLKRGARRLAKKSDIRLREPGVARRLKKLEALLREDRQCKLRLGDVLVELVDGCGMRPVDLARATAERANHLSEMYYVAKSFPLAVRQPHVPYSHFLAAMRMVRKFKTLKLDPVATLREISSLGLTQHRDITAHFAAKMRAHEAIGATPLVPAGASGWVNTCLHADVRAVVNGIADGSAKMIHCDPPYANYRRVPDGRYSGGSVTSTACDNGAGADAIALTVDILRDWGCKLAPGGVLLLWQAAGVLREPITDAIRRHSLEVEAVAIWDKGTIQPGNFSTPYSVQTEWLYVLKRAGDTLVNHDGSRRGDILRFRPVHRTASAHDRSHAFEKPLDLCRFLVGKHTHPEDLVIDLCACTGSLALAAAQAGRRWLYVESNADNFALGARRLEQLSRIQVA